MTKKQPKISVCIPTYNRARYLDRCIISIIGYQGNDIEIIIQNNCSTDNTEEIVKKYKDKRLKYYKNLKNIGIAQNFISIICRASGEYVYILTDDDMLLPDAIDNLKDYIYKYSPDAFKCDLIIYLEKSKACQLYSYFKEDKYSKNVSNIDIANIIMSSHVFTGLCFKKKRLDYKYLKQYGDNWYPSMLLMGLMVPNVGYLAQPTAIHIWENKTFWGIRPDNTCELNNGIGNIILALKNKIDKKIYKELVKIHINLYTYKLLSTDLNKKELIEIKLVILKKIIKTIVKKCITYILWLLRRGKRYSIYSR